MPTDQLMALVQRQLYSRHITVLCRIRPDSLKLGRNKCKLHRDRNPKTLLKCLVHVPHNHAPNTRHSPKHQTAYQGRIQVLGVAFRSHQMEFLAVSHKEPFQDTGEFSTSRTGNEHLPLPTAQHPLAVSTDPKTPTPTPHTNPSNPLPTATPPWVSSPPKPPCFPTANPPTA